MIGNIEQFAKDVQKILAEAAGLGVGVYDEPPRDSNGVVLFDAMPFVVYDANPRSPEDEAEEWTADLFVDVWALGGWAECFRVSRLLDDALSGYIYEEESGVICADRNGLCYQRNERDPEDERLRRMSGQYLLRFNPID
jgi:hypothetical protein